MLEFLRRNTVTIIGVLSGGSTMACWPLVQSVLQTNALGTAVIMIPSVITLTVIPTAIGKCIDNRRQSKQKKEKELDPFAENYDEESGVDYKAPDTTAIIAALDGADDAVELDTMKENEEEFPVGPILSDDAPDRQSARRVATELAKQTEVSLETILNHCKQVINFINAAYECLAENFNEGFESNLKKAESIFVEELTKIDISKGEIAFSVLLWNARTKENVLTKSVNMTGAQMIVYVGDKLAAAKSVELVAAAVNAGGYEPVLAAKPDNKNGNKPQQAAAKVYGMKLL